MHTSCMYSCPSFSFGLLELKTLVMERATWSNSSHLTSSLQASNESENSTLLQSDGENRRESESKIESNKSLLILREYKKGS